jgi:hypothetical protein
MKLVCALFATLSLLTLLLVAQDGSAPGDTDAKKSDDAKKAAENLKKATDDAKAQTDYLKQQKALVEAQRELLLSLAPPSDTKALEGKTTIQGKLAIETEIIADRALAAETAKVGAKLAKAKPEGVFVFVRNEDITALSALQPISRQIRDLKARLDRALANVAQPPPDRGGAESLGAVTTAPALATGLLSSVADLVALFRTDTEITAQEVTITTEATMGHLAKAILEADNKASVYYAELMPPRLLTGDEPALVKEFRDLEGSLGRGSQVLAALDRAATESKSAETPDQARTRQELRTIVDIARQVVGKLNTPDAQSNLTPLMNLAQTAKLSAISSDPTALTVVVKVLKAGGTTRVDRNLFRGSRVQHTGGFLLACFAFDNSGRVFFSETVRGYEGPVSTTEVVRKK